MSLRQLARILKHEDKGAQFIEQTDTMERLLARRFREMLAAHYVDQEEFDYLLDAYLREEGISPSRVQRSKIVSMLVKPELPLDNFRIGIKLLQINKVAVPTHHGTLHVTW